jgi:hypothetical protein
MLWDNYTIIIRWIPSGKRLHNYGKIHHFLAGEIHYFDWAIFKFANCKRLPEGKPPFSYGFPMVNHDDLIKGTVHGPLVLQISTNPRQVQGLCKSDVCHSQSIFVQEIDGNWSMFPYVIGPGP